MERSFSSSSVSSAESWELIKKSSAKEEINETAENGSTEMLPEDEVPCAVNQVPKSDELNSDKIYQPPAPHLTEAEARSELGNSKCIVEPQNYNNNVSTKEDEIATSLMRSSIKSLVHVCVLVLIFAPSLILFCCVLYPYINLAKESATTAKKFQGLDENYIIELFELKYAYEDSLRTIKQLRATKLRQTKFIRKLQSELNQLMSTKDNGDDSKLLLPPIQKKNDSTVDNSWILKRAKARSAHRRFATHRNIPPSDHPKLAQWLFDRASLRDQLRKRAAFLWRNENRHKTEVNDADWYERRQKARGKLRRQSDGRNSFCET